MSNEYAFSKRTDWPLAVNRITSTLDELRSQGTDVLDLTESNPTRCGFLYPVDKYLSPLMNERNLHYTPSCQGLFGARQAVSEYYNKRGIQVPIDRIFLVSSTSEAYSVIFRLLADFGDHILFPQPSYPLFQFLVDLNDLNMDRYHLLYDDGWKIDFAHFYDQITERTKAVVLVNPNNPTGSYIDGQQSRQLNDICLGNHMAIISDEVFWDFAFDQSHKKISLVENDEVLSFSLGGISKVLGLPQMKLSWIIVNGPREIVREAMKRLEVICDTYLSVSAVVQNALEVWLSHSDDIQKQMKDRIQKNFDFLKEQLRSTQSCRLLKCEGGWYAVVKIPRTRSEEEWVLKFLGNYHVLVHPGFFFDFNEEAYMVVSLLTVPAIFEEGMLRVLSRIEQEMV